MCNLCFCSRFRWKSFWPTCAVTVFSRLFLFSGLESDNLTSGEPTYVRAKQLRAKRPDTHQRSGHLMGNLKEYFANGVADPRCNYWWMFYGAVSQNSPKIQTVGTITKLSETEEINERIYIYRSPSKYKKRNGWTNVIERDWNWLQLCFLKTVVSLTVFQGSFVVFNVWKNVWEVHLLDTKLWFCHSEVKS